MSDQENVKARLGGFRVIEKDGDIFDAPDDSVLIHAVNCEGLWGSGIAKAFKGKYPTAFAIYKSHCKEKLKLTGTCLLIPPQLEDYQAPAPEDDQSGARRKRRKITTKSRTKKHWIGCLFTSQSYGKATKFKAGKDPSDKILSNTRAALRDLREQVERLDAKHLDPAQRRMAEGREDTEETSNEGADGSRIVDEGAHKVEARPFANLGPIYACKFNSGSFGVEWKDTRALIEEAFDGSIRVMHVVSPPPKGI